MLCVSKKGHAGYSLEVLSSEISRAQFMLMGLFI